MAANIEAGAIRPTLFIGLGGTGKEVLLRLRRKFYESFGEAGLPCVKYLWLDTDTRDVMAQGEVMDEIYKEVRFTQSEQVSLLQGAVGQGLADIFRNKERFSYIHRWLYPQVEQFGQEISDGAGNVRAVGRLAWFKNYGVIDERVKNLAQTALDHESINATQRLFRDRGATIPDFVESRQAVVVFSVVGGTGAGTFLDTAFLLRQAGLFDQIIGINVLPNVYFQDRHQEVPARSYANSYAALKELEYFTVRRTGFDAEAVPAAGGENAALGSIDYEVQWERGQDRKIAGPPFHVVYMLERQNECGIGLRSRPEFFRMVAESLYMDFMPGQFSTGKRSSHSNVRTILAAPAEDSVQIGEAVLPQTFSRRYASFGMAKLEIPVEALKNACACQLAADLAQYWCRECKDMDILRSVRNDLTERHLSLDGLAGRFVPNWKDEVRREVERVAGPLRAAGKKCTLDDVESARTAALNLEDSYLGGGTSPDPERNLPHRFNVRGPAVLEEVKKQLLTWLEHCIEQPERGLKGLLMTEAGTGGRKGYLQVMAELLQSVFVHEKSDRVQRRKTAEEDSETWRSARDESFEELKKAVTDRRVDVLNQRAISIEILGRKMMEAEEQYLLCKAEVSLYDICGQVAQTAVKFLDERTVKLAEFSKSLDGLAQPFLALREDFLRPGDDVLFIQVYDEAEDWPKFYKLGDEAVSPSSEAKLMQKDQTLFKLYGVWQEQGIDHLRAKLRGYCEGRFIDDFGAHPRNMDLLQHPAMRGTENIRMKAQQLVAAGLARAQLSAGWGHGVRPKREAYVGIAEGPNEERLRFTNMVHEALVGRGFNNDEIRMLPTNKKGEAYLYTVNYAFPLSMINLVGRDCHDTYYTFYQELQRGQVGTKQYYRIPVHMDRRWEGQFDDLTWMEDDDAKKVKEAYEILLFGAMLGITYRRREKGMTVFGYRRRRMGSLKEMPWGGRRDATELLKGDGADRRRFLKAIAEREAGLSQDQLRAYVMAMRYLFRVPVAGKGTVEASLLEDREKKLVEECAKNSVHLANMPDNITNPEDLWDWVKREAGDLIEKREDSEVPVLKDMPVWEYTTED